MADDIVQKGLNLQVEAEDLASATLVGIADSLDDLQSRAESVFEAISMAGADAASSLGDSAGLFAPAWISELEQLDQAAEATFGDMGASAVSGAATMAGAASSVTDAWSATADAVQANSDTAIGSLDSLGGAMGETADEAEATSDEIADAYSADSLGLASGTGALEALQGEMEGTAGVAAQSAGEISDAWDGGALGLDSANGSLGELQGQFDETASVATGSAGDISAVWAGDALGLDGAKTSLSELDGQFTTTADDAAAAAKKIAESFSGTTLGLDAGKTGLAELDTQMATAAADAKAAGGDIGAAFAGTAAAGGEGAAVGTGAAEGAAVGTGAAEGAAAGEIAGISFGKSGGFSLPIPSLSALMTGGITGAIGLGATDLGMQQLEGLESFKAQTGMDWQQVLTTSAAAKGVGLGTSDIQRLIQRLDTNIGKLTQQSVLGATAEGKAVQLGFGRQGVDPTTLKAVLNSLGGTGGASLAMKTLGLTPSQLTGMDANQQLAVIAQKLDGIQNNTLKTAVTNELFGKGTDTAFLLQKFTEAETEAQKNLPAGLAADLKSTLGGGGDKSMMDLQENEFYLEVEMSASLLKMVPMLSSLVKFGADHTKLMEEMVVGLMGGGVLNTLLSKKVPGAGGSTLSKEIEKLFGSATSKATTLGAGYLAGGGGSTLAGVGGAGGALTGLAGLSAIGIYDAFLGGKETSLGTAGLDKLFMRGGNFYETMQSGKGGSATQQVSLDDLVKALQAHPDDKQLGTFLNQIVEASALKKINAPVSAQNMALMQAWEQKEGMPLDELNPLATTRDERGDKSVNSVGVKSYSTLTTAIDGLTKTLNQSNFSGIKKGLQSGNPLDVLSQTKELGAWSGGNGADYSQSIATLLANDIQKNGPKVKSSTDTLLLSLVQSAEKHGKDFSAATDTGLKQTEQYLQTHKGNFTTLGTDLLKGLEQGLEKELPTLQGEAKKIADQLEATLRAALQTHSPSEMTAAIGEDLMQGLALGMERATPGVAATAGRQALLAAGPLATPTVGAGGGAGGAGAPIQIVIELDGKTLTNYVMQQMHQRTKLLTRFN